MRRRVGLLVGSTVSFLLAFAQADGALGDTFIVPGVVIASATIYEDVPDANGGAYESVCIGNQSTFSSTRRGFVRYGFSIPASATVTRVILTFTQERVRIMGTGSPKTATLELRRITSSWTEGAGGSSGGACGSGELVAGVDWAGTPSVSAVRSVIGLPATDGAVVTMDSSTVVLGANLVADVQTQVGGGAMFGWQLRVADESTLDNARLIAPTSITVYYEQQFPPTGVTSLAPTLVTQTSALLNGSANPGGIQSTGWFRYDTTHPGTCNDSFGTRAPTILGSSLGASTSPIAFGQPISGLSAGTTYYYCAIASNAMGVSFGAVSSFTTPSDFRRPTLINGWQDYPGTQAAAFALDNGIVYFRGALYGGDDPMLFVLPANLRPETNVYVAVDLCNATVGRLVILPSGEVLVQTAGPFSDANCFTSLEGASFAVSSNGFTGITLVNGWVGGVFSTSPPASSLIDGVVHLKGAIGNGTSDYAFTLPAEQRPATIVYLQIGLCNARKGRLAISPNGNVAVVADGGLFSEAQCFTSLDGAKFAPNATGFDEWPLQNGWAATPYGTSLAAISLKRGVVHFKGATSGGSSDLVMTLPPTLRPEGLVYIPIDLFGGAKGRLVVLPSGEVFVNSPGGLGIAQGFTSLDGASFAVPEPTSALALIAGVIMLFGIAQSRSGSASPRTSRPDR